VDPRGQNKLRRNFFARLGFETILRWPALQRNIYREDAGFCRGSSWCYVFAMIAKTLEDVLQRVAAWPEAAQAELAEIAREIDAEIGADGYEATPAELSGIDRGLRAAHEGRFATSEQVEELFRKHRPA